MVRMLLLIVLPALIIILGFAALGAAIADLSNVATLALSVAVIVCATLQVFRDQTRRGDAERRKFIARRGDTSK